MHSRDMEYIVGLLKNGKDAEGILSVRRKLNMAFLARTTDLSGKLPVLAFLRERIGTGRSPRCSVSF